MNSQEKRLKDKQLIEMNQLKYLDSGNFDSSSVFDPSSSYDCISKNEKDMNSLLNILMQKVQIDPNSDQIQQMTKLIDEIDHRLIQELGINGCQNDQNKLNDLIDDNQLEILRIEKYSSIDNSDQDKYTQFFQILNYRITTLLTSKHEQYLIEMKQIMYFNKSFICNFIVLLFLQLIKLKNSLQTVFKTIFNKRFKLLNDKEQQIYICQKDGKQSNIFDILNTKKANIINRELILLIQQFELQKVAYMIFQNIKLDSLIGQFMSNEKMQNMQYFQLLNRLMKVVNKSNLNMSQLMKIEQNMMNINKNYQQNVDSMNDSMISYMIKNRYQYMMIYLIKIINLNDKQIESLIQTEQFLFLRTYIVSSNQFFIHFINPETQIFKLMMDPDQTDNQFLFQLEFIHYLAKEKKHYFSQEYELELISKYEALIIKPDKIKSSFINYLYVYCKIGLTLQEFCQDWQRYYNQFLELSLRFVQEGSKIVDDIKDDVELKIVLFQKHSQFTLPLIELLFNNKTFFCDILNKQKIQRALSQLWLGESQFDFNMLDLSYNYKFLFDQNHFLINKQIQNNNGLDSKQKKLMKSYHYHKANRNTIRYQNKCDSGVSNNIFDQMQNQKYIQDKQYMFQFDLYLKNLGFRKLYNSIVLLILFIVMIMEFEMIIKMLFKVEDRWITNMIPFFNGVVPPEYQSKVTVDQQKMQSFINHINNGENNEQDDYHTNFISICDYWIKQVYKFSSTTDQNNLDTMCSGILQLKLFISDKFFLFNVIIIMFLTECLSTVVQMLNRIAIVMIDLALITSVTAQLVMNYMIYYVIVSPHSFYISYMQFLQVNTSILTILIFFKLVQQIALIKTMGIYIKLINNIFVEVMYFTIYYISIIGLFTIILYFLYHGMSNIYQNRFIAFNNTFSNTMGNLVTISPESFTFSYLKTKAISHNIFVIFFQFLTNVLLLNTLIAILSHVYNQVILTSELQYSQILYDDYQTNKPNKYIDSTDNLPLVMKPLLIIIYPLVLITRDPKINRILNIIIYFIKFFIPFCFLMIIVNVVLAPFAYLKALKLVYCQQYYDLNMKVVKVSKNKRILHFLQILLIGPFYFIFRFMIKDIFIIYGMIFSKCNQYFRLLFDLNTYLAFKLTVFTFNKQQILKTDLDTFFKVIKNNYLMINQDSVYDSFQFQTIYQRLHQFCEENQDQVDICVLVHFLDQIKNRQLRLDNYEKRENKLKMMELFMSKYLRIEKCGQ